MSYHVSDEECKSAYRVVSRNGRLRMAHVAIVEELIGRPLPGVAIVHHVDGNGLNNNHNNLVVCPSQAYHKLLHARQRARDACGNPDWRKCAICKQWDDQKNLAFHKSNTASTEPTGKHRACDAERARRYRTTEKYKATWKMSYVPKNLR